LLPSCTPCRFSFGSDAARRTILANYAKAHRAQQFALLQDAEAFIDITAQFRDALLRRFRDEIP
jgi:hypothetical protein